MAVSVLQLTVLTKSGGPLTKRISLADNGLLKSDGSACIMSSGTARRFEFSHVQQVAALIEQLGSHQAIALGRLRPGLSDEVEVTTRRKLNGAHHPNLIARTHDYLIYRSGEPALALIDYDRKGMPLSAATKVEELGGFWPALVSLLPELEHVARVVRSSTSAGLFRDDTGEKLASSGGQHGYVAVQDGSDIERFLKTLHARCLLAGFGWLMVGAGGQLLERSIVDRVVGSPERLVFEGAPVLDPPLAQDPAVRRPTATEGELLDTVSACPPLSILEQSILRQLRAKFAVRLAREAAEAKYAFVAQQTERLTRAGMAPHHAARVIERQCVGVLLPDVVLPFDDEELAGRTVADVLANPERFEGATLADPLEGVEYGRGKAKIMRRADGTLWINSFAHGRTAYDLRFDYRTAKAAIEKAPKEHAEERFERVILTGDLSEDEIERLRNDTAGISGAGRRALEARLKRARQEQLAARARGEKERRIAERRDPRPQIPAPAPDAPFLPQMQVLNDVLANSCSAEPPMRDADGWVVQVRARRILSLHALTTHGANHEDTIATRLPAPEQPLLYRLDEPALAELIERHIEYVDETHRPVHLASAFVKHYLVRADAALPVVAAVATLPILLPDGTILTGRGLDRRLGVVMRVPHELHERLPKLEECTPDAVAKAMRFLTHEWLFDVSTDYEGRCVLIACAMTVLERVLLPERPAFFITAGQRGGGKTTACHMLSMAALGHRAAAAAWSPNEDERRKALFAYLGEGVPFLVWDNLPRGAAISCPSVEKALTAEIYSDRVLGASEQKAVPAYTIQIFTGNNITARGDLASRSLCSRLESERPDPENRDFKHPDPIAWTEAHRGRILSALYTVLLGNPRRRKTNLGTAPTRFKAWWELVGSAVEHGAEQHARVAREEAAWFVADPDPLPVTEVSFKKMFLAREADDEQTVSMATVLEVLRQKWPCGFQAADVARYAGQPEENAIAFRSALEHAAGKALKVVTSTTVAWRLKGLVDAPVQVSNQVLVLRHVSDANRHGARFSVVPLDR
jgi:hypothetical protein